MRILFSIGHPAHVHFFKNSIKHFESNGDQVKVITKDKDIAVELLDAFDIEHEVVFDQPSMKTLRGKLSYLEYELATIRAVRSFQPDVITGIMGVALSHASVLTRTPSVIFADTEHATVQNLLSQPFADLVCVPDCYDGRVWGNSKEYPGYHELSYLHPNRFEPDSSILREADLGRDERFVILRLVSWEAVHDVGDSGFDDIVDVVETLEETGVTVRITSEDVLPKSIEDRQVSIPPHKIHDLMSFAELYIGESATMATESAVLGTPAIFVSSSHRGYTDELEKEYGLVSNFSGQNRHASALREAVSILNDNDDKEWETKRDTLLSDKIDTTLFAINQIQNKC